MVRRAPTTRSPTATFNCQPPPPCVIFTIPSVTHTNSSRAIEKNMIRPVVLGTRTWVCLGDLEWLLRRGFSTTIGACGWSSVISSVSLGVTSILLVVDVSLGVGFSWF